MIEGAYFPTLIPAEYVQDWIPPEQRTADQLYITDEFHERIGEWSELQFATAEPLPERVLDYEVERSILGELLPRPYQLTGSCVGVGWWRAYCNAMCGDVFYRGDVEDIKLPFAFATYGVGRALGGARGRGEGSYGGQQAKAGDIFGALPIDYPGLPKPTVKDGWLFYDRATELQWSHPSAWPIPRADLEPESQKHKIGEYKRLRSGQEVKQAKALGYGVTLASSFGTRGCRVTDGVLLAEWDGSWAHQMSNSGYWQHPSLDLLFPIDNQWRDAHGHCPLLYPMGVTGTLWIREKTMDRICERGEVYAHTATGGFRLDRVDWKGQGVRFSTVA